MASDDRKYREYQKMVDRHTPSSAYMSGYVRAFWVGGLICALGQAILILSERFLGLDDTAAAGFTSICLVFIGTFLTGLGVYDDIGRYAGAGSVVPITGFANSIAAPAMEFRREGLILGVGAKLFAIAGPVLVYGITASMLAGAIWLLVKGGGAG